jgi:hypothetical protein
VAIANRGFNVLVSHRLLQRLEVHAAIEAVGRISVTQFVRQDHHANLAPRCLDRALDVGFRRVIRFVG